MEPVAEWTVGEWVEGLARRTPTPAGGALALVTLAGAAALAAKMARLRGRAFGHLETAAAGFLGGAGADGPAYQAARRGGEAEARASLALGLAHLGQAAALLEALHPVFDGLPPGLAADVAAAEGLARASARVLLVNLAVNLDRWGERFPGLGDVAGELDALRARLEAA